MRLLLPFVLLLASVHPVGAEGLVTLRAGQALDGTGGRQRDAIVVVRGSRIERWGGAPEGPVYDLSGLTLLPGGIDTHVHLLNHFDADGKNHTSLDGREPREQALLYGVENAVATLRAGITTVQSLGARGDGDIREALARGTIPGPRVVTSYEWITEGDERELREAVRDRIQAGADAVKIFASKSIREGGTPTLSEAQLRAGCPAHGRSPT